jgi:hypothetical protein
MSTIRQRTRDVNRETGRVIGNTRSFGVDSFRFCCASKAADDAVSPSAKHLS